MASCLILATAVWSHYMLISFSLLVSAFWQRPVQVYSLPCTKVNLDRVHVLSWMRGFLLSLVRMLDITVYQATGVLRLVKSVLNILYPFWCRCDGSLTLGKYRNWLSWCLDWNSYSVASIITKNSAWKTLQWCSSFIHIFVESLGDSESGFHSPLFHRVLSRM